MPEALTVPKMPKGRPELKDAMRILMAGGYTPSRVIDVHTDAFLWLNQNGWPRTTFVSVEVKDSKTVMTLSKPQEGFVVDETSV